MITRVPQRILRPKLYKDMCVSKVWMVMLPNMWLCRFWILQPCWWLFKWYFCTRFHIIFLDIAYLILRCGCTFEIPSITRFVMKWQLVWFFRRQLSLKSLCHYNLFYSVFCLFSKHNFYVHICTIGWPNCDGTRHLINIYLLCIRKHPDRKWEYQKEVDFQRTKRYDNTWCDCFGGFIAI